MYIDINAQPESSCSCASAKNTPLNGAWQQQGRFIETAFGARCSVLGASCNYTAAAAFVTKNCLPKFIELKMHFGHK